MIGRSLTQKSTVQQPRLSSYTFNAVKTYVILLVVKDTSSKHVSYSVSHWKRFMWACRLTSICKISTDRLLGSGQGNAIHLPTNLSLSTSEASCSSKIIYKVQHWDLKLSIGRQIFDANETKPYMTQSRFKWLISNIYKLSLTQWGHKRFSIYRMIEFRQRKGREELTQS